MATTPPTVLQTLQQALVNVANQIQAITLNPKPTYSVDGESYSWSEHLQMLLTQQIELERSIQRASGPAFEVVSRGYP